MGYLFLAIVLLSGKVNGYCGKKISDYTRDFCDAVFANRLRMVFCIVIGFLLLLAEGNLSSIIPTGSLLWISAFSGITTALFVVLWLICAKRSAFMMLDISLTLGVLIPLILSQIFFRENIRPIQWFGILVLFAAVVIMGSYNNSIKEKLTLSSLLLLLLCGSAHGMSNFSQKVFMKCIPDGSATAFNLYTFVFASIVLSIALSVGRKTTGASGKPDLQKIFKYILSMAVCLFANSYFKTLAAGHLDAVILYPLNQGGSLILSALMSSIFFKEKITKKAVIGIITAFTGLIIINLL